MGTIRVITLDREYGCGGHAIAARLAERLGWKLWDEELCREVARRANCDLAAVQAREERRDPLYYRLFRAFLRGSLEPSVNRDRLSMIVDAETISKLSEQLVRAAADEGNCVIVGRGSQYFLHDRDDTYHVFLYAPYEEKIRRERETGRGAAEARRLVDTTDRDRAAFIRHYLKRRWPNRQLYHLMVNSKVGDEAVVETILRAVDARAGTPAR